MKNDVVPVIVKGVMPTSNGCAVFLGDDDKTFVIYVDHSVGNAIQMTLDGIKKERPLTHDLIGHILTGLGASIDHVVINDVKDGTFFARILLRMENELGKKIVELDARPSDAIALALRTGSGIWMLEEVVADASIAVDAEADAEDQADFRRFLAGTSPAELIRNLGRARQDVELESEAEPEAEPEGQAEAVAQ
jgi:bifunctional DNase/RNase